MIRRGLEAATNEAEASRSMTFSSASGPEVIDADADASHVGSAPEPWLPASESATSLPSPPLLLMIAARLADKDQGGSISDSDDTAA